VLRSDVVSELRRPRRYDLFWMVDHLAPLVFCGCLSASVIGLDVDVVEETFKSGRLDQHSSEKVVQRLAPYIP
jgi:hypothetical protein